MSNASPDAAAAPYVVVARRYRPQSFGELVGQEHVAEALRGAIATSRVGHAYLFTGARGVGKTSSARILAKCLNCVTGPTATPCNECDICKSISSGDDVDVLEIDGASNRGIDEIRELRQKVNVRPSRARFKIYIIDEVHMLTREASMASGWTSLGNLRCLHQRGVSGIDGMCSGVAGMGSVAGPAVALVGDVTLLHDLHGLFVAGAATTPLVVAVIANGGGRIFDQIQFGRRADLRSAAVHFTTPVSPDFAALARFCNARHFRVEGAEHVEDAVGAALSHPGLSLLELVVDPTSAAEFARSLPMLVEDALAETGLIPDEPGAA